MLRLAITAALTVLLTGCGVTGDFRGDPGYVEFDSVAQLGSREDFSLSLGPLPLRLAAWALEEEEPEIRSLLQELRGVRVHTLELAPDAPDAAERIESLKTDLLGKGWLNVITVRGGSERASVLLRPGPDGISHGLAVIVQEPSEVVLVNLIGNVRLDLLNAYMAELDVKAPRIDIDPTF